MHSSLTPLAYSTNDTSTTSAVGRSQSPTTWTTMVGRKNYRDSLTQKMTPIKLMFCRKMRLRADKLLKLYNWRSTFLVELPRKRILFFDGIDIDRILIWGCPRGMTLTRWRVELPVAWKGLPPVCVYYVGCVLIRIYNGSVHGPRVNEYVQEW